MLNFYLSMEYKTFSKNIKMIDCNNLSCHLLKKVHLNYLIKCILLETSSSCRSQILLKIAQVCIVQCADFLVGWVTYKDHQIYSRSKFIVVFRAYCPKA